MRIINVKVYLLYINLPAASIAQPEEPGTPNLRVLGSVLSLAFSVTMVVTKMLHPNNLQMFSIDSMGIHFIYVYGVWKRGLISHEFINWNEVGL